MAEQQPAQPASAGFKLKLKLGGGNAGSSSNSNSSSSTIAAVLNNNDAPSSASHATSASMVGSTSATADAPGDTSMGDVTGYSEQNTSVNINDGQEYVSNNGGTIAGDDGDFTPGSKKSKASSSPSKKKSVTPIQQQQSPAVPSPSVLPPISLEPPSYSSSIGSIVLPPASTSTATAPKRKKGPTLNPGAGRGWRKGVKGYIKPEGDDLPPSARAVYSPAATATGGSLTAGSTPPPFPAESSRRRKANISMAEEPLEDEGDEDFLPTLAPPGGLATSDKWQNGLPGGNEQSRQTAAMAAAVNKLYPVGPPPKTGSGFLPSLPLDKNTPRPRSWKKAKREMLGPGGVPFYLPVWIGDNESPYADYMIDNPRPPPVDKKALAASLALGDGAGSPLPEGSYPNSENGGTPLDPPAGPAKRRKRLPGEPKRKPGPPKKVKLPPQPAAGSAIPPAALTPSTAAIPGDALPAATAVPGQLSPAIAQHASSPAAVPQYQASPLGQNDAHMGHFG